MSFSDKKGKQTKDFAYDSILNLLISSKLNIGDLIPSERSLSNNLNASRPTIRKALRILEQEGFILCKPSIGYCLLSKEQKNTDDKLKKQKLIGLIWSFPKGSHQFGLIQLLEDEFSQRGYSIILGFSKLDVEEEAERIKRYVKAGVQGLIIMPAVGNGDAPYLTALVKKKFPITFLGQPRNWAIGEKLSKQVNIVGQNEHLGMEKLINHLNDLGHKDIAFVGNKIFSFPTLREQAFRQEMQEKGLTVVEDWMFKVASGPKEASINLANEMKERCFSKSKMPTAIICVTEEIAHETKKAILSLGFEIPGDISIATFASVTRGEILDDAQPEFTSIYVSEKEFAKKIIESIMAQINGSKDVVKVLLDPVLKNTFVSTKLLAKNKELKSV